MISEGEGTANGFGPYEVAVVRHFMVKLKDGVRLALKIWFPSSKLSRKYFPNADIYDFYSPNSPLPDFRPCPVVMEYIPYRKADFMSERDYRHHSWMASYGYVMVHADMRGSGDSDGLYYDEYTQQEQSDACELITWYADQEWCNGRVGMYGKSWGGFNGLQVAYCEPPALKAVVSLYSTDDRYQTDIGHMGGCIPGHGGFFSWASFMFNLNALPPNALYREDWKSVWLDRLQNASAPWTSRWLRHQTKDDFWKHGSVNQDFSKLKNCAFFLIGGWQDGYRDAVFRMVDHVPVCRAMIGPWSHNWPDVSVPGPKIAYLDECKTWWDYHLKGIQNDAMDSPKFRVYMRDSLEPAPLIEHWPGKWIAESKWPPRDPGRELLLIPDSNSGKLQQFSPGLEFKESERVSRFSGLAGMWSGPWLSFGSGYPGDQKLADALSITWRTDPLVDAIEILGNAELDVTVSIDSGKQAMLAARLVDLSPTGSATLICHGILNLLHRNGHEKKNMADLSPGQRYKVKVTLLSTSYTVPPGHQLGLAVSSSYWPFAWPARDDNNVSVFTGSSKDAVLTSLKLPVLSKTTTKILMPETPRLAPPMKVDMKTEPKFETNIRYSLSSDERVLEVITDSGEYVMSETNTAIRDWCREEHVINGDDMYSAKILIDMERKFIFPTPGGENEVRSVTHTEMWADQQKFYLLHELKAMHGKEAVFKKTWNEEVNRDYV